MIVRSGRGETAAATAAELLCRRGRQHAEQAELQQAVADFSEALAIDPTHEQAAMGRGSALNRMGLFEQALDDYAITLSHGSAASGGTGRATDAVAVPEAEAAPSRTTAEHHYARGLAARRGGDFAAAARAYTLALAAEPTHFAATFNRAFAYDKLHDYEAATLDYQRAIELSPNDASIHYNLGISFARIGQHSEAVGCFSVAVELATG